MRVFVRKPRIGLHDDGFIGIRQNFLGNGQKFVGAERTVCSHRIREGRGGHRVCGRVASRKGAAVLFETHRTENGQIAVFFGRKKGCFEFRKVRHRLDQDKIRVFPVLDHVRKGVVRLLKCQAAHRFEQPPERADVQRHEFARCRPARDLNGRAHEFLR